MNGLGSRLALCHTADQCGRTGRAVTARKHTRTAGGQRFRDGNIAAFVEKNIVFLFKDTLIDSLTDGTNDI